MSGPALSEASRPIRMTGPERVALVALALASAVIIPGALNRFVFGKLALAALGIACAAAVPARGRLPRIASALLAMSALLLVLAALAAPARVDIFGLPPRYEGLVSLTVYLGALVAGARLLGAGRARGSTALFLWWLSLSAVAIGAIAVLAEFGLDLVGGVAERSSSLLGNASDEGAWAVLVLGPLGAVAVRGGQPAHVAGACGAAAALVCSGSRGALVGALVVACTLVLLLPGRRSALTLVGAAALTAVAAFALPGTRERILQHDALAAQTVDGRRLLWRETTGLVAARPVLGFGPSSFVDAIPIHHTRRYEETVGPRNPTDSPHNWVLQAAVAGGVGLALLALALAAFTLESGRRAIRHQPTAGEAAAVAGFVAGLIGYAVALLAHFTSPGTTPLAAVFAGALLASRRPSRAPAGPRWRRAARNGALALFAGLTVLLATAGLAEVALRSAIREAAAGRIAAADERFHDARRLRPWDHGIATGATHAFATLATLGIGDAARAGTRWSAEDLAAHPRSVRALVDAGALAAGRGDTRRERELLARALRLEPNNPELKARTRDSGTVARPERPVVPSRGR